MYADKRSMSSYVGGFARLQIKQRRKAFRRHWPLIVAITAGLCVLSAAVVSVLLVDVLVPAWFIGPVIVIGVMEALRTQLDGTYHLESSIEAEGWTSTDLRRALGPRRCVVDGVSFGAQGDVDHVVVGPSGVFAVETKYTDSTMDSRTGRALVRSWVAQSQESARRVRLLFKHNYGHEVDVWAAVVTSGTESLELSPTLEGTDIVRRRDVKALTSRWRDSPPILSSEEVESVRAALLAYRVFERTSSAAEARLAGRGRDLLARGGRS